MRFDDETVLNFFLSNGIVATMRDYHYTVGKIVQIRHGGKIVARGKIIAVLENNETFQRLLVKYSGFKTIEEWENRAKELNKGKLPRYIVIVKLR